MLASGVAPTINNRYHLHEVIGQGGMGSVYRAYDRLTAAHVALKSVTVFDQMPYVPRPGNHDPRLALAQEFRLLASLRHPHIISVLDYGFDTQPYYTMQLLSDAQSIAQAAAGQPQAVQLNLIWQTLQALRYLHQRGIIHRDLKPSNILVVDAQVKVLDFGLATAQQQAQEAEQNPAGTLAYMAPEVIQQGAASPASDLFAVGLIAYEILTGDYPFDRDSLVNLVTSLLEDMPPLDHPALSPELSALLGRLLAKSPADRYARVDDALSRLAEVAGIPYETPEIRESYIQAARFIGRSAELDRLRAALGAAQNGEGALWLVGGESGVGKTRLMEEVRALGLVEGALVLQGQAMREGGAPFALWRDILRQLCLTVELSEFEASVLQPLVPDISTLLGREVLPPPDIPPDEAQARLFNIIESLLGRQPRPVVIILEDLQWAHEGLLVMQHLGRTVAALPLLLIGTYRIDERPALAEDFASAQHIRLERLTADEIHALSQSMLGDDIAPPLLDLLVQETEGNVFFIVEAIRSLADQVGELTEISSMTLPERIMAGGMQQVIQYRLRQVPPDAYPLLQLAAAAGREIDPAVLGHLAPQTDIERWLERCQSALEVRDNRWLFSHDKLREWVYNELDAATRRAQHAAIARAIEATAPDRAALAPVLAYHWGEAGHTPEHVAYLTLAGDGALKNAAYRDALSFAERALQHAEAAQLTDRQIAMLHRLRGDAYLGLGELTTGYEALLQALAPLPLGEAGSWRAFWRLLMQQAQHRIFRRARVATSDDAFFAAMARACETLGIIHYFRNDKRRALFYSLAGLNIAEAHLPPDRAESARLHALSSVMLSVSSWHRLGGVYQRRAQALVTALDVPEARTMVGLMRGVYATNVADWATAYPALEGCVNITRKTGNMRRYSESLLALAAVCYFSGDWDRSAELGALLYEVGGARDNVQAQAWGLDDQARILYRRGDLARARALLVQSAAIYDAIDDATGQIWVHGARISIAIRAGEPAHEDAEALLGILRGRAPGTYGLQEGYQGLAAYALHRVADDPALADEVGGMLKQFAGIFYIGRPLYARYLGGVAAARGETSAARRHFRQAAKLAAKYNMPYDEGLALGELARHDTAHAASHRARAAALLERLSAADDLARLG